MNNIEAAQIPSVAKRGQPLRWVAVVIAAVLVLTLGFIAYRAWRMSSVPTDLDFSMTRASAQGLFKMTLYPALNPIPTNRMHSWRLHLESADGTPVENAAITVKGGMPQHGHGLPTQPKVTQYLGKGDYLVEGMKFQMGGWWVVDFDVIAGTAKDQVGFNLMLK